MAVEMYLFRVLSGTGSAQLGQSRRERATLLHGKNVQLPRLTLVRNSLLVYEHLSILGTYQFDKLLQFLNQICLT